jgi:predicted nucleotidyltransferase
MLDTCWPNYPSVMLDLTPKQLDLLMAILRERVPNVRVYAYGSRATGKARPFSDLDLALDGEAPIPSDRMALLREDLTDSDLPMRVDVVDLQQISEPFKEVINAQRVALT